VAGGFYLGSTFVHEYETENQSDYQLSLGGDYEALRSTSNVEELWINPEDMGIPPEEIQVNQVQFILFSPGPGGFYMQAIGI